MHLDREVIVGVEELDEEGKLAALRRVGIVLVGPSLADYVFSILRKELRNGLPCQVSVFCRGQPVWMG
jgi:hypothetical protein